MVKTMDNSNMENIKVEELEKIILQQKEKKTRNYIVITLKDSEKDKLEQLSKKTGISMSELTREIFDFDTMLNKDINELYKIYLINKARKMGIKI